MTIEERITQDAATWRDSHIAPPFDTAFERALATPPRRRRAWLAAAAAVVLVAAIATFAATRSSQHSTKPTAPPDRWTTHSLAGLATVEVPARWFAAPFRGLPATVYFPLLFFSTHKIGGPCTVRGPQSGCTLQNQTWFPRGWRTPRDGVLVLWSHAEFPTSGSGIPNLPGRRVVIDHRPARIQSGAATSCPSGAATEINAYVRAHAHSYPGERFDMIACLGPHVSRADRAAVQRMLRSLHIRSQ